MGAAEELNLDGDWLTEPEAATYCRVSLSQFKEHALAYGLTPRRFMGKKVYEKAALYKAIYESSEWHVSPSTGATASPISTGAIATGGTVRPLANSATERLRRYEQRRKRS